MTKKELAKHYKEQMVLINASLKNNKFSKEGKEKCKLLLEVYDQFIIYLSLIK